MAAQTMGIPGNTPYVVTATYPDGMPYPDGQYTDPGSLYGHYGSVSKTDPHGQLDQFIWAAYNGQNSKTDPPGTYTLKFYYKNSTGIVQEVITTLHMQPLGSVTAPAALDPSVHLLCLGAPCVGADQNSGASGANGWNGRYVPLSSTGILGNANYVVTATYPDGAPYPLSQYSNEGTLDGIQGSLGTTDPHGDPFGTVWAAYNGPNAQTDPPGVYTLTYHVETAPGHIGETVSTTLLMAP